MNNIKNIIAYMRDHGDKLNVNQYLDDYGKEHQMYIDSVHKIAIVNLMNEHKDEFYYDNTDGCYHFGKTLPTSLKLDLCDLNDNFKDAICEAINEYLSTIYGYCVNGYCYDATIKISDIDWDRDDD